jgi:zinc/manganese transport system permease protein
VPLAALIAVAATWVGLAIAFWQPYPVSFFVTALTSLGYLAVRLLTGVAACRRAAPGAATHA